MERNNLPGLTPAAIIVLATIVAALLPIGVAYQFGGHVNASDWIGFAGNVITAGVAAIAITYAWRGIKMQTEIDLISREEERMEALLPGLEAAFIFLTRVQAEQAELEVANDNKGYARAFLETKFNLNQDDMRAEVDKRLPITDAASRLLIAQTLTLVKNSADLFLGALGEQSNFHYYNERPDPDEDVLKRMVAQFLNPDYERKFEENTALLQRKVEVSENSLRLAKQDFDRLVGSTSERICLFQERMPKFRARIEKSYGKN
jgi:hypothetical protein